MNTKHTETGKLYPKSKMKRKGQKMKLKYLLHKGEGNEDVGNIEEY